ncbi:hypothetical protein C4D60_Mb09t25860 [Musa balbisiana]|uniref:Uncharacterized protein n=1 Tax=Musa balbisiana TaxID=52838 RepID=A0A4S8IJ79_MUSBA|nr:hypothetical protein C4D60_Mb09t25860 [Musa balbisiana]
MYHHSGERSGQQPPSIADDAYEMISKIESSQIAAHSYKDFDYDYFGFKPLEVSGMLMGAIVRIRKDDDDSDIITYHFMSQRWFFTHASPTLSNAGIPRLQIS